MAGTTDDLLVLELRKGNTESWHEVYRLFQPRLFSYLVRLSGRPELAQDLSSETWCRAAAKLHSLRPGSQLLPWLFTIARNLFFSYCRWRNRDEHYLNELGLIHCRSSQTPTPLERAIRWEQETLLEAALMQLPRLYREAIILVGIEGLSHEQAAQVAGIRADAIRKRFSRGIQLLREIIAQAGKPLMGG